MQKWVRSRFISLVLASTLFVPICAVAGADKGTAPLANTPTSALSGGASNNQLEILSLEAKRVFDGGSLFWKLRVHFKNQLPTISSRNLTLQCHQEVDGSWRPIDHADLPPTPPGEEGVVVFSFPMTAMATRMKVQIYSPSEQKYISNEKVVSLPSPLKKPSVPTDMQTK